MTQGVRISVRSDMKRTVAEFSLERKKIRTATYRALNRAQNKVSTEAGREIRKVYNVRQKAITSAFRKLRASMSKLTARLVIEGVRIGLIEFAARQTKRGVTVRILKSGGRKLVKGAFITASTRGNYRGGGSQGINQVWRRAGKERYPIFPLRSVSIPQAFMNKAVLAVLDKHATETFNKNLQQQLRYLSGA
jgi:hypothetical protein